jgi:hypothetical protein
MWVVLVSRSAREPSARGAAAAEGLEFDDVVSGVTNAGMSLAFGVHAGVAAGSRPGPAGSGGFHPKWHFWVMADPVGAPTVGRQSRES